MINNFDVILLMAGTGSRLQAGVHKGLMLLDNKPLFTYSLEEFLKVNGLKKVLLVVHPNDLDEVKDIITSNYDINKIFLVKGGVTRSESVRNALKLVTEDKLIIHDAARPYLETTDVEEILSSLNQYDASTYFHDVHDTIKLVTDKVETLPRSKLKAVSTPQGFTKKTYQVIANPHLLDEQITDELSLLEDKFNIGFIKEKHSHHKITTQDDILIYKAIRQKKIANRVGHSFDFHPFKESRPLILGGITFDYPLGLLGHSDADVVYHVVAESLIGALGLGDLGTLFPDNDQKYKGIASSYFVSFLEDILSKTHYEILNMDIMIYLEKPNLSKYKQKMAENIATLLNVGKTKINVKATTMEKRGRIGLGQGIACEALVLLGLKDK